MEPCCANDSLLHMLAWLHSATLLESNKSLVAGFSLCRSIQGQQAAHCQEASQAVLAQI